MISVTENIGETPRILKIKVQDYFETLKYTKHITNDKRDRNIRVFCSKYGLNQRDYELLSEKVEANQFVVIG